MPDPADQNPAQSAETDLPTPPPPPPARRPRPTPLDPGLLRVVIVVWCFWLLGAWATAWLIDTSVPRVRWMLFAGTFGLMLVWPAFRLSERIRPSTRSGGVIGVVMLDWLALILVYQAVIWSLHLIAAWPLGRGLLLDAVAVVWSLLTALIVAATRRWPGGLARSVGMMLCIALVFAEPIAMWAVELSGGNGWSMRISPLQALWELTEPPERGVSDLWAQRTAVVAIPAVVGWLVLGGFSFTEKRLRHQDRNISIEH